MFKKIFFITTLISTLTTAYAENSSFTTGADWLYWKAFEDNMEYAADVSLVGTTINSAVITPDFVPRSGFRVFAAYNACNYPWELTASYVRLSLKTSNSTNIDPTTIGTNFIALNNQTFPIFNGVNGSGFAFSNLDSSWHLNFNYFDLDLSYPLCFWSCLKLTPTWGLRGMWIGQKLELQGFSPGGGGGTFSSNFKENFDGYGLKADLIAEVCLGCRFSLIGRVGGSILYARIKINEIATDSLPQTFTINETQYHSTPTFDTFLGLSYQNCLLSHPYDLHLGWEQHVIIHANHLSLLNYANLSLQGLTLGGSISF